MRKTVQSFRQPGITGPDCFVSHGVSAYFPKIGPSSQRASLTRLFPTTPERTTRCLKKVRDGLLWHHRIGSRQSRGSEVETPVPGQRAERRRGRGGRRSQSLTVLPCIFAETLIRYHEGGWRYRVFTPLGNRDTVPRPIHRPSLRVSPWIRVRPEWKFSPIRARPHYTLDSRSVPRLAFRTHSWNVSA